MENTAHLYNELKAIAPTLAELEKINVFSVPQNYFSGLHAEILKQITPEQFQIPASQSPFTVPDGYFENLAGNILQKIKNLDSSEPGGELREISPLLHSIENKNVFSAPAGYFTTLPGTLISIVRPQAKVVALKKRSIVWNCAAAAMITGIMAVTALWTGNTNTSQQQSTVTTVVTHPNINEALQYKNQQQINEGIADLSDADIVKYLETTGSNADDEALASGISEKELPDEKDYLKDENTLQIFLGKTGSNNSQN